MSPQQKKVKETPTKSIFNESKTSIKEEESELSQKKQPKLKSEEIEKSWQKIKEWSNKRNDFITDGQIHKLAKEVDDLTLRPQINESSRKIVEKVI